MANYYFDTNALIKYSALPEYKAKLGKAEKGVSEIRQLAEQENNTIYYSSLTLLECWSVLFLNYRSDIFGKEKRRKKRALHITIEKLMLALQSSTFAKLDSKLNETIVLQARNLIEGYGTKNDVGSMDMLHVALVKASSIEALIMVSSDRVVKNICDMENINTFNPENVVEDEKN